MADCGEVLFNRRASRVHLLPLGALREAEAERLVLVHHDCRRVIRSVSIAPEVGVWAASGSKEEGLEARRRVASVQHPAVRVPAWTRAPKIQAQAVGSNDGLVREHVAFLVAGVERALEVEDHVVGGAGGGSTHMAVRAVDPKANGVVVVFDSAGERLNAICKILHLRRPPGETRVGRTRVVVAPRGGRRHGIIDEVAPILVQEDDHGLESFAQLGGVFARVAPHVPEGLEQVSDGYCDFSARVGELAYT